MDVDPMNATSFPPPAVPPTPPSTPAMPPLPPQERVLSPLDVPRGQIVPPARPLAEHPARHWIRRFLLPIVSPRTWKETIYQLLNLPVGIATFTVLVVMYSVGVGLTVVLIGIPILLSTIAVGRLIGVVERGRAKLLLGVDYRAKPLPDLSGNLWKKCRAIVSDGPGWGGIGYGFAMFPWGIFTFVSAIGLWSVSIAGVTAPFYVWSQDVDINGHQVTGVGKAGVAVAAYVGGGLLLIITPWIIRAFASADRWMVRTLLSQTREEELASRVSVLTQSRDASVDSAASELRRIERDLHDGAQQRLVALAMDLGLAKERLASGADPERAAELVGRAHDEAKLAITELRDLVRGIHPSVLTDRGLDAALSALAARSPVPVDVQVELTARPPAAIEAAAYFVVAEALTNVAKHSGASAAWVRVTERGATSDGGHRIVVEVRDDGHGGAEPLAGGGLAGLRDRVLAVEGRLRIASPEGGPTMLVAELPCAS
jgi:signal transduction histidine kinase/uncharacterized protein YjeT (DUF2065 family)